MERVWDRFLTEQDVAALAKSPRDKPDPRAMCERPALLLIDLYRNVFGHKPQPLLEAMDEWPSSCGLAAWEALPHIEGVLEVARSSGIPVVHTTGVIEGDLDGQHGDKTRTPEGLKPSTRAKIPAKVRYEIIEQVAPVAGESVVRKISSSAFWGTPLLGHLITNRIDTLIVCGESTSGCVRASVVDAAMNGYNVILCEDGIFDRHQATHAMNLFDMHRKFGEALQSAEVAAWMGEFASGQRPSRVNAVASGAGSGR